MSTYKQCNLLSALWYADLRSSISFWQDRCHSNHRYIVTHSRGSYTVPHSINSDLFKCDYKHYLVHKNVTFYDHVVTVLCRF